MSRIDLKFLDTTDDCWIKVEKEQDFSVEKEIIKIVMYCEYTDYETTLFLDKSTAIKFAKTLRTEINKIQD
tara:strand:+ start:1729 stop:1941 length:213 start_codon:yes stop_codon:yes gene_type:complete